MANCEEQTVYCMKCTYSIGDTLDHLHFTSTIQSVDCVPIRYNLLKLVLV